MASIPLCTPPRSEHAEGEGEAPEQQYRLLEISEDIARLIESAQERQRSRTCNGSGNGKGTGNAGSQSRDSKRRRTEGSFSSSHPHHGEDDDERECLIINGRHNDEAVLSTQDKTHALREVSQSNSLLLCAIDDRRADGGSRGGKASSKQMTMKVNISSVLELSQIVPRLDRVSTLLRGSAYEGDEEEKRKTGIRKYTPREVRSIVQASDAELQAGYNDRCVLLLDGYMRSVSPAYLNTLLKSLLLIIDANGFLSDSTPIHDTVQALQDDHDVRTEVATLLLTTWFGRPAAEADLSSVQLDMNKIAKFIGEQLLKESALQPIKLDEYMDTWARLLSGAGAETTQQASSTAKSLADLALLKGLYILFPIPPQVPNPPGLPRTIQYYPKSLLPLDPAPRFQELFLTRSQWFLEELEPFIEDLSVDPKRREALLLRYARAKKVKMPIGVKLEKARGGAAGTAAAAEMREVTLYSARVRY